MFFQLLFAVLNLFAGVFELLFGFGQRTINRGQHFIIQFINFGLIQFHADLAFHQAAAGDRGHAIHPFQRWNDGGGGEFRKLIPSHIIAIHRQHHNGQHIRIDFHQHWAAGTIGQATADLIEAGIHFDHGGIHAGAFLKFQHDNTDIFLRDTGNIFDAAGGGQGTLQRFGHALFHLFRAGADVGGIGNGIGKIHVRQKVGGHIDERHNTKNEHQYHADEDGHGLFDAEAGKHRAVSPFPGQN